MQINMMDLSSELEAAYHAYPWPVATRCGELHVILGFYPPGKYYLCTDSHQIVCELPDGPHTDIILDQGAVFLEIEDEVWQAILHSIGLETTPEEVLWQPSSVRYSKPV